MNDTIDNETGEVTEPREMVVADENLRTQIAKMDKQFAAALPPHIPVERFTRVVQTALTGNPDLQKADRASLFEAAMKAAQDGLLPDGRDGALVIFNTKVKRDGKDIWIKKVQWMPMVGGILKKVRNSGELLSISAHVVYTKDKFFYSLGDEEKIEHTPLLDEDRGVPMCVYAIAKTKDGGIYREVMTLKDVEKVRNVSKAKDAGPWTQWWDEMARKSVIRRLAKRLPTSADLDDLLRHDDELYDFSGKRDEPAPFTPVANPLKDDPESAKLESRGQATDKPAQTTQKDPKSEVVESGGKKADPISSGTGPSARAIASATTLIDKDSMVIRSQHGEIKAVIVDQRFPPAKQVFMSTDAWAAATSDMPEPEFRDQPDDGASNDGAKSDTVDKASETAAGAASAAKGSDTPAKTETAQATPAKPYDDGESYMTFMRDNFDRAKGKAAVTELWGSTRADRNALLSPEQIDEITADKEAKLKAFKLAEGK
jgi:recombination protein RecT